MRPKKKRKRHDVIAAVAIATVLVGGYALFRFGGSREHANAEPSVAAEAIAGGPDDPFRPTWFDQVERHCAAPLDDLPMHREAEAREIDTLVAGKTYRVRMHVTGPADGDELRLYRGHMKIAAHVTNQGPTSAARRYARDSCALVIVRLTSRRSCSTFGAELLFADWC